MSRRVSLTSPRLGDAAYFTNPTDYVPHLHGHHLDWLRGHLMLVLVVGEGAWGDGRKAG